MEASMSVLRLQSCTCPCKYATTASTAAGGSSHRMAGRSNFTGPRVDSNSMAGSRQEFDVSPSLVFSSRRRVPSTTRCLYSPLVESYDSSKIKPYTANGDGTPVLVSPSSISFLRPTDVQEGSPEDVINEESFNGDRSSKGNALDDSSPAPQDPIAAPRGESAVLARGSDGGHHNRARRIARYQPQTMSLTHGFRTVANQGVSCAIGVAGRPIANATRIGGPTGLVMGLAVAGLGIATAIHKAVETQPQQKLCSRCDGYGVECCDVCAGAGQISWEGKAHRTNPCPRCFGSRLKKCPRCDGCRVKKDNTAVLQMIKTAPKAKK